MLWIGLIVFYAVLLTHTLGQYASECRLPNQQMGRCMPVKSCKPTYEFFQNVQASGGNISPDERQRFMQLHCGSFNNVPLACCSESDIQLNPDGLNILKNQTCGMYSIDKVSNGDEAALSGFPWMALLVYNDTYDPYQCGGALISEQYVLTAAHCIRELLYQVRLGEHRISTNPDCIAGGKVCAPPVVNIDIAQTIVHHEYRKRYHDIALLRLSQKVQMQRHIKPICLPIYDDLRAKSYKEYVISGWGRTDKAPISDVLMVALVPLVERPQCQAILRDYRLRVPLTNGQICAGNRNLIDTCDGDSGGPLGYKDNYDGRPRFIQFGIVSFGVNFCGEGNAPNTYTNVSHYLQWITDNMMI